MLSFTFHPITVFIAGVISTIAGITLYFGSIADENESQSQVLDYQSALFQTDALGPDPETPKEKAAIERFTKYLKNIYNVRHIKSETSNVYAPTAYLNDTLATHRGIVDIEKYFISIADAMSTYQLNIQDISRSGSDHYIRWEMVFSSPQLSKGELIHSIGMTQVRFDKDGKVLFHQNFWDSGQNIYSHIRILGGMVKTINKFMQ